MAARIKSEPKTRPEVETAPVVDPVVETPAETFLQPESPAVAEAAVEAPAEPVVEAAPEPEPEPEPVAEVVAEAVAAPEPAVVEAPVAVAAEVEETIASAADTVIDNVTATQQEALESIEAARQVVIDGVSRAQRGMADFVSELRNSKDFMATVRGQFHRLPKLSIDYALMERATRVLNIEAGFDWDDVGNWTSVGRYLDKDAAGNQHNAPLTTLDAADNLVFSQTGQHIALLGVHDLIVIAAGDALLVTTRAQAENIKKLADKLPASLK